MTRRSSSTRRPRSSSAGATTSRQNPNDVQQKFTGLGDPNNQFWHGYWTLEPGQALVLEAMPPVCDAWNFQLNNYWEESLDYRYFPCHINKHTAKYEQDGSLLIVISPEDPGIGNWMNTVGHRHGTLGLRWTRAIDPQKPKLRVVPIAELKARGGSSIGLAPSGSRSFG